MLTRILTGVVLAPLVVALVLLGPPWGVALLVGVAAALCLHELLVMAMPDRPAWEPLVGVAVGVGVLAAWWVGDPLALRVAAAAAIALPALLVLLRVQPIERAAPRLLAFWGGLVYVVLSFLFVLELARTPGHVMMAFAVVWLGDTGAYFAGRALGRHKLYPAVSPKKTWEGSVGGLLASVAGAFLIRAWLLPELSAAECVLLGGVGGAIAQAGDLVESLLKRTYGVKDSGRLLPGHGGMLDRLDAFLFAAPFLALVLT